MNNALKTQFQEKELSAARRPPWSRAARAFTSAAGTSYARAIADAIAARQRSWKT